MYNMVKLEIKKIIFSIESYVAVAIIIVGLYRGGYEEIVQALKYRDTVNLMIYWTSIFSGITELILPIVCIIPIVSNLWNENNSGYRNMVLMRTDKKAYIISKILSAVLSGVYIVGVASIIFFIMLYILGIDEGWTERSIIGVFGDSIYYQWLMSGDEWKCNILMITCYSLVTIPYTMLALVFSQIIKNKYVLVIIPVIVHEMLLFICYANTEKLFYLNPATWNVARTHLINTSMGGLFFVIKVMTIIILICGVIFAVLFRRRLRCG